MRSCPPAVSVCSRVDEIEHGFSNRLSVAGPRSGSVPSYSAVAWVDGGLLFPEQLSQGLGMLLPREA